MQIVQDKHKYATDNDINKRQRLCNVICKELYSSPRNCEIAAIPVRRLPIK